jgi:hypothetical protein
MNKIEKKATYHVRDGDDLPVAYNSALYLSNRQVSWLIASLILLSFFIFIAGYFLGQRKAVDHQIELVALQGMAPVRENPVDDPIAGMSQSDIISTDEFSPEQLYKAQLIGFGTMRAAHQFADRLQQKNLPVRVQERHSKTAQGKEVIWYQVTTELFNDKKELMAFVEKIKKEERLKDIRIVTC